LNAKIGLLVTLIVTAVIGVYGIELGIRVSTVSGHPEYTEYLFVVLIITVLLLLADMLFYRRYKRDKQKN